MKCQAIAAAVLGDPDAFEIVWTDFINQFLDLRDEKFDILMRTDHTASRDIFDVSRPNNDLYFSFEFSLTNIMGCCARMIERPSIRVEFLETFIFVHRSYSRWDSSLSFLRRPVGDIITRMQGFDNLYEQKYYMV